MNTQKSLILFAGFFALALLAFTGLASAASLSVDNIDFPTSIDHDAGSFEVTFDLTNAGQGSAIDWSSSTLTQGSGSISVPALTMADGSNATVTEQVTATVTFSAHQSGNLVGQIVAHPASGLGNNATVSFTVSINEKKGLSIIYPYNNNDITSDSNGTIQVVNTGNVALSGIGLTNLVNDDFDVTFSTNNFNLNPGSHKEITVSPTTSLGLIGFEGKTAKIMAEANDGTSDTETIIIPGTFCDDGEQGANINISITDINIHNRGDSDDSDDDVWVLGDEIKIDVDVKNRMDDESLKDIIVEVGLFDSNGVNVADDLDYDSTSSDNEKDKLGSIKKGDEETAHFVFKVPPNFDAGSYKLVVKAYDDGDEDTICTEEKISEFASFSSIDVREESNNERYVIVDNFHFPDQSTCGDIVSGGFTVYNIGEDDQTQVKVKLTSSALGVDEDIVLRDNLNVGDDQDVSYSFTLPNGLSDGTYTLGFRTYYDYDDSDDSYGQASADTFTTPIHVIGCSTTGNNGGNINALVNANLASTATPGQDLTVLVSIKNTGTEAGRFTFQADGYQSWADSIAFSDRHLDLEPGQTETIELTIKVKDDAKGQQSFTFNTIQGSNSDSKEIVVDFGSGSGLGFNLSGSGLIWVIGAINLVLIILIIVVAVRLSRR